MIESPLMHGEWDATTSGGSIYDRSTFYLNPQFVLKGSGLVTVILYQDLVTATNPPSLMKEIMIGLIVLDTNGKRVKKDVFFLI